MTDAVVLAAVLGVAGGIALTLLLLLSRRLARGSRDLGSDAEQAAYRALHEASLAAPHLREGLGSPGVGRAARHLRTLLGSAAVVLVEGDRIVAADGDAEGMDATALRLADRVRETARPQVSMRLDEHGGLGAAAAPLTVDGEVIGVLVAFANPMRAALVRAAGEVGDWCAAQVGLGELEASRTALAEAELRALRAQISPHFIYNALTAIASFIHTDPPRARELVLEFADFTRYSFRRQGEFTTLAEELRSIHSYLELERARFGERLAVVLTISPETLSTTIPFLSVQPLVENAVRHGLEPGEGGGTIRIASRDEITHTEITVEDDGGGMDPIELAALLNGTADAGADTTRMHIGLRNVDTRLRQLYGPDGRLVVETNTGAGTLVRMRVPKSQPMYETGLV